MLRLLAALAVLVLTTASVAGPLSRWSATALPGPGKLAAGGSGQSTLAVVRDGADALRSTDGGLTWTTFTVRGQRPLDIRRKSPIPTS